MKPRLIIIAVALLLAAGCASYKQSSLTPDGFNYTVAVDHKTADTSSYVGFTWNLKP